MATRELAEIKDKNGDVNELRDKKLADSIAKNTVVNTDNVRMVDTNGKEVFIARDSFISAIRNVLGGFILSNTKAEAPNIPVFDSNGDFGAITAANLASVLGVGGETIMDPEFKWFISESDWESICRYAGTTYKMVAGYTGGGYGILLLNLGNGRMQLRVDGDGIKVKRATSANTWSNWTLIGT